MRQSTTIFCCLSHRTGGAPAYAASGAARRVPGLPCLRPLQPARPPPIAEARAPGAWTWRQARARVALAGLRRTPASRRCPPSSSNFATRCGSSGSAQRQGPSALACARASCKVLLPRFESAQANRGRLLAVADEDGYLAVVNTAREIPESTWPEDMEPGQVRTGQAVRSKAVHVSRAAREHG